MKQLLYAILIIASVIVLSKNNYYPIVKQENRMITVLRNQDSIQFYYPIGPIPDSIRLWADYDNNYKSLII